MVDNLSDQFGIDLPERRDYETLAGFIIETLQRLPATGEVVAVEGWSFEIVDMDGRRIDKVIAKPIHEIEP